MANEPLPRHLEDVRLRLPRGGLEEVSGATAELDDLHPFVDDDSRRRVAGQEDMVGLPLRVSRWLGSQGWLEPGDLRLGFMTERQRVLNSRAFARLEEDPMFFVDRHEEAIEIEDAFASSENKVSRMVQAMMQ